MAEQFMKIENYKNGVVLGAVLGAAILWGDKIRGPLIEFLNSAIPKQVSFLGALWAPLIIIGVCALIGYIVDRT